MKTIIFLSLITIALANVYDLTAPKTVLFEEWMADEQKFFSGAEYDVRLKIFSENIEKIKLMNEDYPGTKFGLNKFAHLSSEEFSELYLTKIDGTRPKGAVEAPLYSEAELKAAPAKFDWRTHTPSVITPIKDQGACGSCWSFSTTGNIEGQWALAGNPLTSLSEQNLVDCDHHCMTYMNQQACDAGCNGGLPPNAYEYIIKNGGIDTEASYPYEGVDGSCRFKPQSVGAKISNWTMVSKNEEQIAAYLAENGPLSVAVDAVTWQFYMGGVYYLPCGTSLDHAVLIVGYDTETDIFLQKMPYWIVKNSWGSSWGEEGYIYIERGNGKCGINNFVSSAKV